MHNVRRNWLVRPRWNCGRRKMSFLSRYKKGAEQLYFFDIFNILWNDFFIFCYIIGSFKIIKNMGKLVSCTTCGSSVSNNATSCPYCGEREYRPYRIVRRDCFYCNGTGRRRQERKTPISSIKGEWRSEYISVICVAKGCEGGTVFEKEYLY